MNKEHKYFNPVYSLYLNPCVWPTLRVHPNKLMRECGQNYMKELYPEAKH